jgi:two-component system response regulator FixJ
LAFQTFGIVDDDPAILDSLRFLLKARRIDVACFESAGELLAAPNIDHFSGLLVDQQMPDMSGIELVELLKSRKIGVPAVMMTGGYDSNLASRAVKAGVRAVLKKPLDRNELLHWIDDMLGGRSGDKSAVSSTP